MTELVKDYLNGMRIADIKRKYYTTNIYDKVTPNRHKRYKDKKFIKQIAMEYKNGAKIADIMKKYEVSRTYIITCAKGHNIKIRKNGKPRRKVKE